MVISMLSNSWWKEDCLGLAALHVASTNGHLEIIKVLVEQAEGDVNTPNNYGETPLVLACKKGYLDVIRFLVESTLL